MYLWRSLPPGDLAAVLARFADRAAKTPEAPERESDRHAADTERPVPVKEPASAGHR